MRGTDEFSRFIKPCLPMAMVHADFVGMKKKNRFDNKFPRAVYGE